MLTQPDLLAAWGAGKCGPLLSTRELLTNPGEVYITFQGCCDKLPQTQWPQPQGFILSVLEAASLKSRCQQAHAPLAVPRGQVFLAWSGFWRSLGVLGAPRLGAGSPSLCLPVAVSSVCVSGLLIRTPVLMGSSHTLIWSDLILNYILITSAGPISK